MTSEGSGWKARARDWGADLRRRSATADVIGETVSCYRRNRLGRVAALLAHYGFLSVFPLLVCFATVLGFVLEGNPDLQADIVDSALSNLPLIGQQLEADPGSLRGNGLLLTVSLLTAIWAGLKAFVVAQTAIDDIDGLPPTGRLGIVGGRLRALATIGVIGLAQVLTAVAAAVLSVSPLAAIAQAPLVAVGAVLNIALVALAYHLLSTRKHSWHTLRPGALLTGLGYVGLQLIGSLVVGRAVARATPVYGTFATVIGMLTWLALHASLALVGFQLNVVLEARRLRTAAVAVTAEL